MTPKRLKYWEANKINIMNEILTNKFSEANNPELRLKLLATGWEPLEERNSWNDRKYAKKRVKKMTKLKKIKLYNE